MLDARCCFGIPLLQCFTHSPRLGHTPPQIYKLAKEGDWATKHKFLIGGRSDVPGDYSDMLSRAIFCLVAAGELN